MSTFDRLPSARSWPRWRARADRLRQAVLARRPAARWGLALVAVLALVAAAYWTAMTLAPVRTRYLASGRPFSSEDQIKICRAFDTRNIPYGIDDRRIEILADQFDQATAVFAKLDVGPHAFDEIREPSDSWGIWQTREEREQRQRLSRERMIARFIDDLDGVVWSLVAIQYPRTTLGRHPRTRPSAFVYLETQSNRPLPSRTVETIPAILLSNEPELSHETITVMDRRGHRYLDPRNPALGELSRDRAQEEDIREKILEKLGWIKGVQVWVGLIDRPDAAPAGAAAAAAQPEPSRSDPPPTVGVNRPLVLEEPGPRSPPQAASAAQSPRPAREDRSDRGRVLVNVPRSFYFNAILTGADHREPTVEELKGMAAQTKEKILKRVSLVVPDSWTVDVDMIPDDIPPGRPAALPPGSESRRRVMDWGIVAAVVAAVAAVSAVGSWIQVARRPARRPEPVVEARRYRADPAAETGPSERVRELVRRDPEAAASVLRRWTAQGGHAS
jgi:hypothetical protein